MLVIKRNSGMWTNVKVNRETLERLIKEGKEPELRFRVYNIVGDGSGPARVDIAFDDDDRNFEIQRPERAAKQAKIGRGVL